MEILNAIFVAPFVEIASYPIFFFEVLIGGLLTGVMYSLVALGFVLIFKASGVFNFAQGAMVLFAALAFASFLEWGISVWLALPMTLVVMIVVAYLIEKLVLGRLVNQEPIILFMATIGIAYFLDGFGQTIFGAEIKSINIGIPDGTWEVGGMLIPEFDIVAAFVAGLLVVVLAIFFQKTGSAGRCAPWRTITKPPCRSVFR